MKTLLLSIALTLGFSANAAAQVSDGTCPAGGPAADADDAGTSSLSEISSALRSAPAIAAADDATMGCEERHPGRERLADARKIDAVPQQQKMADCTLAALRSAMGWLASQHGTANPSLYGRAKEMDSIFALALKAGILGRDERGNISGITSLAKVAQFAHDKYMLDVTYRASSLFHRDPTIADLKAAVDAGYPVIVPVCVDHEGCPVTPDDDHPHPIGHAAVIEGFVKDADGREYVIVKHGWRDKDFLWRVDDFEKSWSSQQREMMVLKPTAESVDLRKTEEMINNRF